MASKHKFLIFHILIVRCYNAPQCSTTPISPNPEWPHGNRTGDQKTIVNVGEDALLSCIIMGSYTNDTVLWKKSTNNEILTAGLNRVTGDKRISVIHDKCKLCCFCGEIISFYKSPSTVCALDPLASDRHPVSTLQI